MAAGLPPPPLMSPNGSYYWLEWYTQLTNTLNQVGYPFTNLSFTGSDIASILTRNHNELTSIQGGTATMTSPGGGLAYHMTGKGYVTAAGVGTGMPPGWSVSQTGTGQYTIVMTGITTALPNIGAVATSQTTGVLVQWIDLSTTGNAIVHTTNPAGVATNGAFTFIIST